MVIPLGLLLLGVAQPILSDMALVAQIERPLHRCEREWQSALVGRQETVGIEADEVIAHIAIGGLSIEIEVGVAGEADRGRGIRAGDEIHHQIALLQPVLQRDPQVAGKALIPRPGEQGQPDPVRLPLLELPVLAMKPRPSAVQAVGRLVGIQRPALAVAQQLGVADAVGKAPRHRPQPHLLSRVDLIGAAQQHFAAPARHRQGEGGEGGAEIEAAQAQPLLVFQLERDHGITHSLPAPVLPIRQTSPSVCIINGLIVFPPPRWRGRRSCRP